MCLKGKRNYHSVIKIKHQVKNRINLVGRELGGLKWPHFLSTEVTNYSSNRCFSDSVGCRAVVRGRENLTHKYAGTTSNEIGSIFLHPRGKSESHTLSDRQQGSLVLRFENGEEKERTYDQIKQRYLALSSKSQCVYHSGIHAFSTEYSSRQGIKKKTGSSLSQIFSSSFLNTRFSDNRSILLPTYAISYLNK